MNLDYGTVWMIGWAVIFGGGSLVMLLSVKWRRLAELVGLHWEVTKDFLIKKDKPE